SPMLSFAKLPAVEAEAAATGATGRRRFSSMWPRAAVGGGGASGLRLAVRYAVSVAVEHLGGGAGLGDAPSLACPSARPAIGPANPSAARFEVFEQVRCRALGKLRQMRADGEVCNGLAQRRDLPV